jgi:hypothetical protein
MPGNAQTEARVTALRAAPMDAWIALSDDETRIVAEGKTYQEVSDALERDGDETSFIVKTPPQWLPLAV